MKRLFFVLTFLSYISISNITYPTPADVEKLSSSDYFPAVDKAFKEAKKSIFVVMYYVEYKKDEADSKSAILLNDLVLAKERGVSVSVILDRTAIFTKDAAGALMAFILHAFLPLCPTVVHS